MLSDKQSKRELENAVADAIPAEETKQDSTELSEIEPFHVEKRTFDGHIVVAALVLTMSFAAAFTIPGGFDTNDGPKKGLAILAKKSAFTAYIVCVTLAMSYSWSTLDMLVSGDLQYQDPEHMLGLNFQVSVGVLALMIAFVCGLYLTVPIKGIRIFIILLLIVSGHSFMLILSKEIRRGFGFALNLTRRMFTW